MSLIASIIIPAYNASAFLGAAIQSAQGQTTQDIEILVVDDCSTDKTWDVAASFAASDPRVILIRRDRRGGPSAARNTGFERARGRWIAVLDADDLYLPQRIERLVTLGQKLGADLIADNLLERDFDTGMDLGLHFPQGFIPRNKALSLAAMLARDMPDLPGRARLGYVHPIIERGFLRSAQIRFDEDIGAGEDFLFYFECVAHGAQFYFTPEAHYVYRLRQSSISNHAASALQYSAANRRILNVAMQHGNREVLRVLRHRQEMLDYSCFEFLAEEKQFLGALRYAACRSPTQMLARLRLAKKALTSLRHPAAA